MIAQNKSANLDGGSEKKIEDGFFKYTIGKTKTNIQLSGTLRLIKAISAPLVFFHLLVTGNFNSIVMKSLSPKTNKIVYTVFAVIFFIFSATFALISMWTQFSMFAFLGIFFVGLRSRLPAK